MYYFTKSFPPPPQIQPVVTFAWIELAFAGIAVWPCAQALQEDEQGTAWRCACVETNTGMQISELAIITVISGIPTLVTSSVE
jgi:hypothetical protein